MVACPYCGSSLTVADEVCPTCMGTLPADRKAAARKKRVDFDDESTDGQAVALQAIAMEAPAETTPFCAIHQRARARGFCERCSNPACEICLSRKGVCPACRRQEAPGQIAHRSRQISRLAIASAATLIVFVAYRYLDKTVLDLDPRRAALAMVLALVHVLTGVAVVTRRSFGLAVVATGALLMGLLVPLLGAEPWWMAFVRLAVAAWSALATLRLKQQMDELYLPLDRTE